jgi:hypothetical protein
MDIPSSFSVSLFLVAACSCGFDAQFCSEKRLKTIVTDIKTNWK